MKMETKQDAIELIKKFIDEKLNGEIDNLEYYNFEDVYSSEDYGCPNRPFDCDNSNIMNAIYIVLWGDVFPDCNFANIGTGKGYRGDTVNTFNTMFGKELAGLEKYSPTPDFVSEVKLFKNKICNIGNYLLLPNNSEPKLNEQKQQIENLTFNTYRGINQWRDFFDRFLINLKLCMTNNQNQDEFLKTLFENNKFFFDHYQGNDGFNKLAELYFLEDYLDEDGNPHEVFNLNYHWKDVDNRTQYFEDAKLYITKAHEIISNRAERMVKELEFKLMKYDMDFNDKDKVKQAVNFLSCNLEKADEFDLIKLREFITPSQEVELMISGVFTFEDSKNRDKFSPEDYAAIVGYGVIEYKDFTKYYAWEKLTQKAWVDLLTMNTFKHPYYKHCDFSKFQAEDWVKLLSREPKYHKYCDVNNLSTQDKEQILFEEPKLLKYLKMVNPQKLFIINPNFIQLDMDNSWMMIMYPKIDFEKQLSKWIKENLQAKGKNSLMRKIVHNKKTLMGIYEKETLENMFTDENKKFFEQYNLTIKIQDL